MATQAGVLENDCEGKKRRKKKCVIDGVWLAQLLLRETTSSSQRRG